MKKVDLGRTVSILANVGVIAGIIFLAFELRQNNELLASQARSNLVAAQESYQQNIVANAGGIADIIFKVRTEEANAVERFRLNVHWSLLINNWASMYGEVESGPLDEDDLTVRLWARTLDLNPDLEVFWNTAKDDYSADFIQFVEKRVMGRPASETNVSCECLSKAAVD